MTICALGACTRTGTDNDGTTSPASRSAVTRPADAITLSCADATSGSDEAGVDAITIGPATIDGARVAARAERATASGILATGRSDLFFRKLPLHVRASIRVTIMAGSPGVYLSWVPARVWTTGGPPDIAPWLAQRVTVTSCGGVLDSYFLGGVASTSPACWPIDVAIGSGEPTRVLLGPRSGCRSPSGR